MPIGPYDGRKKTFRCKLCVLKHVKCSGTVPCTYCQKRGFDCTYPAPVKKQFDIVIDKGTRRMMTSYAASRGKLSITAPITGPQLEPDSLKFFHYWDIFLEKNTFSRQGILSADVKQVVQLSSSGSFLKSSVLALGSLTATKLNPQHHLVNYRLALTYYTEAVIGLRNAINHPIKTPDLQLAVLWTTMLLGLFELMTDSSGQRWVQHLVHGTSKALIATGPQACAGSLSKRFFMEIRIFEVCRAIVFNDSSFLMQDEWMAFSQSVQSNIAGNQPHPFDELLDIILRSASLRSQAAEHVHADPLRLSNDGSRHDEAHKIAIEGILLRDALNLWQSENPLHVAKAGLLEHNLILDDFALLACIFNAATSIYLSGVFDYEIHYWLDLGVLVPTLTEDDVQYYVRSILTLSETILCRSKVSAVLLLFPLRVAGARSRSRWQKDTVLSLLQKIEATFSAAGAFREDLESLWMKHGVGIGE